MTQTRTDSENDPVMLLSVRPRYAADILSGVKTSELRRTRPSVTPGTTVLIYATKPVGALVGTCRLDGVLTDSPESLRHEATRAAVTLAEYDAYYAGKDRAHVLRLSDASAFPHPVSLEQLQRRGFHPPRTWHLLAPSALARLLRGHVSLSALRLSPA